MGEFYHKHPIFTTYVGKPACGLINGHHADCSRWGFTTGNETSCVVDPSNSKMCKCTHTLPDPVFKKLPRGVFMASKTIMIKRAALKKTVKRAALKKSASRKRK